VPISARSPAAVLVPQLLPWDPPQLGNDFEMENCLNFRYQYSAWIESLFPRFLARTFQLSENTPKWRYGAVLKLRDNSAIVRADATHKRTTISRDGPSASR